MSVRFKQTFIVAAGGAAFITAIFSMLWAVFPLFGSTLPHLIEEGAGVSFKLSALVVSLVTGVLGVIAMFIFSFFPLTYPKDQS